MQKLLTFFQQKYQLYVIFNDQSFDNTLTNDIVSFEQLGPGMCYIVWHPKTAIYKTKEEAHMGWANQVYDKYWEISM